MSASHRCLTCGLTQAVDADTDGTPIFYWWAQPERAPYRAGPFCSAECLQIYKGKAEDEQFDALFGPFENDYTRQLRRVSIERTRQRFANRHSRGADVPMYAARFCETEPEAPCIWRHYSTHEPEHCPDCARLVLQLEGVMR